MNGVIVLFGESEKGQFCYPYFCKTLLDLANNLGNSPKDSLGIEFAVQALMYEREVIYLRVEEEGCSFNEYMQGIEILKDKAQKINAICIPKVSDLEIISSIEEICKKHLSIIIMSEKDLFDYLISL